MRKFLNITLTILLLSFFIATMLSGNFLKRSIVNGNSVPEWINLIIHDIELEQWDEANKKTSELSNSWDKIVKKVQFSSERDEINNFSVNISRLQGSILTQNKNDAILELYEAYEHWDELGNWETYFK